MDIEALCGIASCLTGAAIVIAIMLVPTIDGWASLVFVYMEAFRDGGSCAPRRSPPRFPPPAACPPPSLPLVSLSAGLFSLATLTKIFWEQPALVQKFGLVPG